MLSSINALSDALAEAENVGDPILIASVCMELSRMFSFRYGALGIYFLRKAEVMLAHEKNAYNLNTVLMYRAMNSMQLYERNLDNSKFQPFKEAAEQAINSVKEELLHPGSDVAYFKRTKGYVMRDENLVGEALAFYQSIHSRPEILRTSEMYIGICLNKQLNDKAKSVLSIYKEAAAGDINRLKHAEELEANLAKYERIDFISPYDTTPHGKTTLLDILDHLALGEERWFLDKSIFRCLYPNYYHEGKFEAVRMPDGRSRLIPCDLAFNDYYRGQNKYVEESRPSLYRKGMTEADVFYERLKYAELKLLIQTYPMAQIYENGFSINFPDETSSPCFFEIDYLALAQHYGIKTELLDLTVDKFVAAFFACTDYHPETDSYTCKTENEGEGVFYHYVDTSFGFDMSNLRSVGLQPFSRPGEQGGFVLEMKPGENFNAMCVEAIHFEHNADIAKFIFNYTNRQKRLFPEGELEKKVSLIKGTPAHPNKVFSKAALALVRKELYETSTDEKIGEFIQKLGLTFREEPIAKFTESEKSDFMVRWKERDEKRFRDRVIVRFAYNGPVTFEGDRE